MTTTDTTEPTQPPRRVIDPDAEPVMGEPLHLMAFEDGTPADTARLFELLNGLPPQDVEVLHLLARAVTESLIDPSVLTSAWVTMHDGWEADHLEEYGEVLATPLVRGYIANLDRGPHAELAMAASVAVVSLETRQRVQWLTERLERLTMAVQCAGTVMSAGV